MQLGCRVYQSTIVLALRVCFRCSLTHNGSRRLDWWCRLHHILAGVRVNLCCNQSAPDRIWVFRRPFRIAQPLPVDDLQVLSSGFLQRIGFGHLQLFNVRKLSEWSLTDLLRFKQGSALGSMVFLSPVYDLLSPHDRRALPPRRCSCTHPQ